jgi:hypothetical protein
MLPAAGWTPARSSCVTLPCTHAPSAFPLGLGVLTGKGITAGRRALARLTPATAPDTAETPSGAVTARTPRAPAPLPDPVTAELVHALAAVAVALAVS